MPSLKLLQVSLGNAEWRVQTAGEEDWGRGGDGGLVWWLGGEIHLSPLRSDWPVEQFEVSECIAKGDKTAEGRPPPTA